MSGADAGSAGDHRGLGSLRKSRTDGTLIGIAWRAARRAQMMEVATGEIAVGKGLVGDHKGARFLNRALTILSQEDWSAALADLSAAAAGEPVSLPWTMRRANLLVEGVRLPRARGAIVRVGEARLEVTYPTSPCARMDESHAGLRKALAPEWRGGVTCRVLEGGPIALGDAVVIEHAPPETVRRLPG